MNRSGWPMAIRAVMLSLLSPGFGRIFVGARRMGLMLLGFGSVMQILYLALTCLVPPTPPMVMGLRCIVFFILIVIVIVAATAPVAGFGPRTGALRGQTRLGRLRELLG